MSHADRRVYTPPLDAGEYAMPVEEGGVRRKIMVMVIMAVIIAAVAASAWNIYGAAGPPPLIAAEKGDFKTLAPPPAVADVASHELDDAMASAAAAAPSSSAPDASSAAPVVSAAVPAPIPAGPFAPQAQGAFLAQIAALRSRDAADEVWRAFSARVPDLAHDAHAQVQRADLGAQGIYYRLRVGFFDSHERAGAFCARVQAAGQDCMVVSR